MSETTLSIRAAADSDSAAARQLVQCVAEEFGLPIDPAVFLSDMDGIATTYAQCGGWFELLFAGDQLVGTVGMLAHDQDTIELRKMYLLPQVRGRGLGRALVTRSLRLAASRGFSRVVLETDSRLKAAIALYSRFGFERDKDNTLGSGGCDQSWQLSLDDFRPPDGNHGPAEFLVEDK